MQILFLAGSQLALVDLVENLAHFFQDQLHLTTVLAYLPHTALLFGSKLRACHFLHLFYFLQIPLEILSILGFPFVYEFFLFTFLDAFLVALHDNGDEDVLDCSVEEDHEDYEVDLSRETLSPGFQEGIIDDISVEERKESDHR